MWTYSSILVWISWFRYSFSQASPLFESPPVEDPPGSYREKSLPSIMIEAISEIPNEIHLRGLIITLISDYNLQIALKLHSWWALRRICRGTWVNCATNPYWNSGRSAILVCWKGLNPTLSRDSDVHVQVVLATWICFVHVLCFSWSIGSDIAVAPYHFPITKSLRRVFYICKHINSWQKLNISWHRMAELAFRISCSHTPCLRYLPGNLVPGT